MSMHNSPWAAYTKRVLLFRKILLRLNGGIAGRRKRAMSGLGIVWN